MKVLVDPASFEQIMRERLGITPVTIIIAALERQLMLAQAEQKAKLAPKIAVAGLAR